MRIENISVDEHDGQCYMTAIVDGEEQTRPISGCVLNDYWNSKSEEIDREIAEIVFSNQMM